jgi:hypothetical protein
VTQAADNVSELGDLRSSAKARGAGGNRESEIYEETVFVGWISQSLRLTERIGFNLNASRSDSVTAVGAERIQDKTRWTKALGEAVTCVYGDCKEEIGQSRCNSTVGDENTGPSLTQTSGWERVANRHRESANKT